MERAAGLYRVGLKTPDLKAAARFYQDSWAMTLTDSGPTALGFRSRGQDHDDLILVGDDAPGLDHVALSVKSEASLRQILRQVEAAGFAVARSIAPSTRPDERLTATVEDLDGNRLELVLPDPAARRAAPVAGGIKRKLGHVVLWTPQIEAQETFYAALGFQVSDRTHIGMSFLRCNQEHHCIALARSGSGNLRGLQHVAFDIGAIDDVMREFGRLTQSGVKCIWGVGRHGPGNNVFSYFRDPAGNIVENYGEMETVEEADHVEARYWGPEHRGDIWGVAGPPPTAFQD